MVAEPTVDFRALLTDVEELRARLGDERRARLAIEEKLRVTDDELIRCPRCFEDRAGRAAMQDHESLHLHEDRIGSTEDRFPKRAKRSSFQGHLHWPATTTREGIVELATTAEIDTGTNSTRAMPIDQFVASLRNVRFIQIRLVASDTDVATGTSIGGDFVIPFTGTLLQDDNHKELLMAYNDTAGVTGTMVADIHKGGTTVMTTNKLDIETGEKNTRDATTQPDLTTTAVAKGDIFTFDVDAIHSGTAAKGLVVAFAIRLT